MTSLLAVYGQEKEVYDYTSAKLKVKPIPSQNFVEWIKKNNDKLGVPAPMTSPEETKVTVVFTLGINGEISSLGVWRGIGQGYDEAAFYAVKNNPYKWSPGALADGRVVPVKVYYQIDHINNMNKIVTVKNKPVD